MTRIETRLMSIKRQCHRTARADRQALNDTSRSLPVRAECMDMHQRLGSARTNHLVKSPLEFMRRRIERQLLGSKMCERYGSNGSIAVDWPEQMTTRYHA